MRKDKEIYVFDTTALLTFIEDEEGSEYIENLLLRAEKEEIIAFISLIEFPWLMLILQPYVRSLMAYLYIRILNSKD